MKKKKKFVLGIWRNEAFVYISFLGKLGDAFDFSRGCRRLAQVISGALKMSASHIRLVEMN